MEKVRISKLMSERGLCSRREADSYIERGWVRVDGVVVSELGAKAYPDQTITLERAARAAQTSLVTILINKPIGYVSGQAEDGYKPAAAWSTPAASTRATARAAVSTARIFAAWPWPGAWTSIPRDCWC